MRRKSLQRNQLFSRIRSCETILWKFAERAFEATHGRTTRTTRPSNGQSNVPGSSTRHRNRGRLSLAWRVCSWASAPSRRRDTGPVHRVLSRNGCAGFARPITWAPHCSRAPRYVKIVAQPSARASPPPTVRRGTPFKSLRFQRFRTFRSRCSHFNHFNFLSSDRLCGSCAKEGYPPSPRNYWLSITAILSPVFRSKTKGQTQQ